MSFFEWTGNPFVDNGIAVMLVHSDKKHPAELTQEDVAAMGEKIFTLYLTPGWGKSMQNIFPNSAITSPAYGKDRERKHREVIDFFASEIQPQEETGGCICCGSRPPLRLPPNDPRKLPNNMVPTKTYVPLNGSGKALNFYPGGIEGADICVNCLFAIQCSPLNYYTANFDEKRFVLIHSNSSRIIRAWSRRAKTEIDRQVAVGHFDGCFNEKFKNINAFFHIVEDIMERLESDVREKNTAVRFYHFDNYNQPKSQPLKIYDLPSPVFSFLNSALRQPYKSEWWQLIRQNYFFVKSSKQITLPAPKDEEEAEERYRSQRNRVFQALLYGKSIIRFSFSRKSRKAHVSWEFLRLYLTEVRFMRDDRIATIKKVADEMAEVIKGGKKKRLKDVESASNYASFRNVLLRFIKDRKAMDAPAPLFSLDEYTKDLFPDGALGWKETQDLLLFRIYETLHDWLRSEDMVEQEDDEEESDESSE